MALTHDACGYFQLLVVGDLEYNPAYTTRGRCIACGPLPIGSYRGELAQWPIIEGSDLMCGLGAGLIGQNCYCRRGCGGVTPPQPEDTNFLLLEHSYVLTEDGWRIVLG